MPHRSPAQFGWFSVVGIVSDASEGELDDEPELGGDKGELSGDENRGSDGEASDESCPANVLVGKRIRVYWNAERKWFKGTVRSYTVDTEACTVYHLVVYDDDGRGGHDRLAHTRVVRVGAN